MSDRLINEIQYLQVLRQIDAIAVGQLGKALIPSAGPKKLLLLKSLFPRAELAANTLAVFQKQGRPFAARAFALAPSGKILICEVADASNIMSISKPVDLRNL